MMAAQGVWGDHLAIQVQSGILRRPIRILGGYAPATIDPAIRGEGEAYTEFTLAYQLDFLRNLSPPGRWDRSTGPPQRSSDPSSGHAPVQFVMS